MKKSKLIILLFSFVLLSNCTKQENSDRQLEQKLIGTWHKDLKKGNIVLHVITKFTSDHRYASYARAKGSHRKYYAVGRWRVKFGTLKESVTKSNFAQPHTSTYDKILTITNKQFVYKTERGNIFSYYRTRNSIKSKHYHFKHCKGNYYP